MSGTNHITGGVVFTGIFASFWNINIFARPELLALTGFFAILPDVDHLKSPIGKAFYPLAKWLDRKYGHRTITHSLLVYSAGILLILLLEKTLHNTTDITLIFAFAYFSHLLFDMLTKQGVPLFYPFRRNPCVIPGNADLRLRSSDLKTEAACFAIFILLGITCQNLFANGFWNTYNRQFTDLKHLHQESRQSDTMLSVEYDFKDEAGKQFTGTGLLIKSTENQAIIYHNQQFVFLEKTAKIQTLTPTRTNQHYQTEEVFFSNITPDSLNKLVHNRPIITLTIQSNTDFTYQKNHLPETAQRAEFTYIVNPAITFIRTEAPIIDTSSTDTRRRLLNYEIAKEQERINRLQIEKQRLESQVDQLESEINTLPLYEREIASKQLNRAKAELQRFPEIQDNITRLRLQLQGLRNAPVASLPTVTISGYISYLHTSEIL